MNPCTTRKEQFKLFLFYAVFATAIPVCIVTLGLILENVYGYAFFVRMFLEASNLFISDNCIFVN